MRDWMKKSLLANYDSMPKRVQEDLAKRGIGYQQSFEFANEQSPIGKSSAIKQAPIPKKVLGMAGMLPLPSQIQQTAQDVQSNLLSPTEKMLRFLLRGTNDVASPAEEWRAKGGI